MTDYTSLADPAKKILWTNPARCRDCNRCVGVCIVKAVRKRNNQAEISPEKCILCGMCFKECPQDAKAYQNEIKKVETLIRERSTVVASIAPSFLSAFSAAERRGLPAILRQLGFAIVTETAVGAELVAEASRSIIDADPLGKHICSACPSVVRYIQKYKPEAAEAILKIASPMVAHGRYLKARYGDETGVVFIGPCIAKKEEASSQNGGDAIDAVLTFDELLEWIEQKKKSLALAEDSDFDEESHFEAKSFPISGGFALTAGLPVDFLDRLVLTVSGPKEVKEAVEYVIKSDKPVVLEALMCPGGCLGGVGMPYGKKAELLKLKRTFLDDLASNREASLTKHLVNTNELGADLKLAVDYKAEPSETSLSDEVSIRQILTKLGINEPSDELNCGTCGYNTCREKARAVIAGMAEIDMCLPYMRRRAELKADAIIQNSPNAIIVLDADLKIVHANPKFYEMFMTSDYCLDKHISYFINPEPFQHVSQGKTDLYNETVHHNSYGLVCQQLVYKIGDEDLSQVVGIMLNITHSKEQEAELDMLRKEAISRAEQVIDSQVKIIQETTKLLGASAAETSSILMHLTDLVRRKENK